MNLLGTFLPFNCNFVVFCIVTQVGIAVKSVKVIIGS